MADRTNYYEVLGVSRAASRSEIRNAYRNLAKERHPDHPGGSAEQFSLLQEAHATLSDPNRRLHHDEALDLAHAADQLSGLDFGSLGDELASRRQQREPGGPSFGERLRERFRGKEEPSGGRGRSGGGNQERSGGRSGSRVRGRYEVREARWYEPHDFDPEPITWRSGAISLFGAILAFMAVGQIGMWATGVSDPGPLAGIVVLAPLIFILYTLTGLAVAYFTYRTGGYAALALAFLGLLIVGQRGGPSGGGQPEGMLQFGVLGMLLLVVLIYLGKRRDETARQR